MMPTFCLVPWQILTLVGEEKARSTCCSVESKSFEAAVDPGLRLGSHLPYPRLVKGPLPVSITEKFQDENWRPKQLFILYSHTALKFSSCAYLRGHSCTRGHSIRGL
jgi:hypothetical protein